MRVVVVEDNPDMSFLLRLLFRQEGFDVDVADDGVEGLRLIVDQRPDAAVIDVALPSMDGLAVLDRLRERAETRDMPVLILSGVADEQGARAALAAGRCRFMSKPAYPRRIVETLENLLAPAS